MAARIAEGGAVPAEILIVEDDESIALLLVMMLRREGLAPQVCRDGRAAEARIAGGPPPALVLMDMMLPYRDGIELVALLRAQPAWRDVPVLMLSAKSQQHDIERALAAGSTGYVIKPFQPQELMSRVRLLLAGTT